MSVDCTDAGIGATGTEKWRRGVWFCIMAAMVGVRQWLEYAAMWLVLQKTAGILPTSRVTQDMAREWHSFFSHSYRD